ncbi:MAG: hypothetical protein U0271_16170 [Polyangiaceae bacterium]
MSRLSLLVAVCLLAGCRARSPHGQGREHPEPTPTTSTRSPLDVEVSAKPVAPAGKDFIEEAKALYRVVACGGKAAVPAELDANVVAEHCRELDTMLAAYRRSYIGVATPFFTQVRPADIPQSVVYPFSGGDLSTALLTYPDATDYTTLSLELVGDPRRLHGLAAKPLAASLRKLRRELAELLQVDTYSKSETLKQTQQGELPGELSFFLVAMALHGYEPVSLKYFYLEEGGTLHYLTEAEIAAREGELAEHRKHSWIPPDFSVSFANSELTFRKIGDPSAPLKVHRHMAVNLDDDHIGSDRPLWTFLRGKGDVAAMTKAASYLLWRPDFSVVRDYLLERAVFMFSDSTGVPPLDLSANLTQEVYGKFAGSLLKTDSAPNLSMVSLFRAQPYRALPFRYGYGDRMKQNHLIVTKRKPASP